MHSHSDATVGERFATEGVIDFDGIFVIDSDGANPPSEIARARHRFRDCLLHDGVAELVLLRPAMNAKRGTPSGARRF